MFGISPKIALLNETINAASLLHFNSAPSREPTTGLQVLLAALQIFKKG